MRVRNIDEVMKNRMVFLFLTTDHEMFFQNRITVDYDFVSDLSDFAFEKLEYKFNELSLLMLLDIDESKTIKMYEPENILEIYKEYLEIYTEPARLSKLLEKLGIEKINTIAEIAIEFNEYRKNKKFNIKGKR